MKDGYTQKLTEKINDWGLDKIYEMEDDIYGLEGRVPEIIDYLKDIHFSMPLGLALRRYMCEQYSECYDSEKKHYIFKLSDKVICTKDYTNTDYDIESDDIAEYIEIFNYVNAKYNTDKQEQLAKYLNVTPQAVSKWKKGLAYPEINLLVTIADYFSVTVDYLLRD